MDTNQIEDVLNISSLLTNHGYDDAAHTPSLIADLINWAEHRNHVHVEPHTVVDEPPIEVAPKVKRGKATESDDSDRTTPDPSADDDNF